MGVSPRSAGEISRFRSLTRNRFARFFDSSRGNRSRSGLGLVGVAVVTCVVLSTCRPWSHCVVIPISVSSTKPYSLAAKLGCKRWWQSCGNCCMLCLPCSAAINRTMAPSGARWTWPSMPLRSALERPEKERGFSTPLLERKAFDIKRESIINMFGSFLPSLGWLAPPKLTRRSEPTLSWNQFHSLRQPIPVNSSPFERLRQVTKARPFGILARPGHRIDDCSQVTSSIADDVKRLPGSHLGN